MKVNATTRGQRIAEAVGKMLPDYDQACIVLRFSEYGVEASVHVAKDGTGVGDELLSSIDSHPDISTAMKHLERELKTRVRDMASTINLAAPDDKE
jgi:hypothetical protein